MKIQNNIRKCELVRIVKKKGKKLKSFPSFITADSVTKNIFNKCNNSNNNSKYNIIAWVQKLFKVCETI